MCGGKMHFEQADRRVVNEKLRRSIGCCAQNMMPLVPLQRYFPTFFPWTNP
jgi:phenylalanyl-tRNA synthetase alpha subunit